MGKLGLKLNAEINEGLIDVVPVIASFVFCVLGALYQNKGMSLIEAQC